MTLVRRVGGAHLALAGVLNGVTGLAVVYLSLSGWLLRAAIAEGGRYLSPAALLRNGELVGTVAARVVPVVGLVLVAVAAAQLAGGYHAYTGRPRRWGPAAAVAGAVNVLALPVCLIAAVLLGMDGGE
ncbi:MAG: hypothetical protein ABEH77_04300 [Halobacteriaceae archaeon]